MPPRQVPTPLGFVLLGMALAVPAVVSGVLLASRFPGLIGRIVIATVGVLSLVAIEALWWARPWVTRAVDGWALACVAGVLAFELVGPVDDMLAALTGTVLFVAVPCGVASRYVRVRSRRLGLRPGSAP